MDIKIGGYIVSVVEDNNILPNEGRIGEYSPFEQKIKISTGLSKQQKNETLIHEILEAINAIYELGLEHDEQLCKMSVILHQIITDNSQTINALLLCGSPKFYQQ